MTLVYISDPADSDWYGLILTYKDTNKPPVRAYPKGYQHWKSPLAIIKTDIAMFNLNLVQYNLLESFVV